MSFGRQRPDAVIVGMLVLSALLVRVGFVLQLQRAGFPPNDTAFYHAVGEGLARGGGYSVPSDVPYPELFSRALEIDAPTARWPPVFTALVGVLYKAAGPDPLVVELANALLGTVAVGVAYVVALRAYGRPAAVFVGGALTFWAGAVMFTDVLMPETLYTLELLVVLWVALVVDPSRSRMVVGVGALVGIAALTRGEGLFLAVIPLAAWSVDRSIRSLVRPGLLVILGVVLVVAPWTVRNLIALGEPVIISTNGAQTFYSGHNPQADGGPTYVPLSLLDRVDGVQGTERELEAERITRDAALTWLRQHPLRELELIPLKIASLNRGSGAATRIWLSPNAAPLTDGGAAARVAAHAASLTNVVLLAMFVAVLAMRWRSLLTNPATRAALAMLALAAVLYGFVLYGNFRYRLPLEPLMLLVCAALVQDVWRRRANTAGP
jgi:hypothetical protein